LGYLPLGRCKDGYGFNLELFKISSKLLIDGKV